MWTKCVCWKDDDVIFVLIEQCQCHSYKLWFWNSVTFSYCDVDSKRIDEVLGVSYRIRDLTKDVQCDQSGMELQQYNWCSVECDVVMNTKFLKCWKLPRKRPHQGTRVSDRLPSLVVFITRSRSSLIRPLDGARVGHRWLVWQLGDDFEMSSLCRSDVKLSMYRIHYKRGDLTSNGMLALLAMMQTETH